MEIYIYIVFKCWMLFVSGETVFTFGQDWTHFLPSGWINLNLSKATSCTRPCILLTGNKEPCRPDRLSQQLFTWSSVAVVSVSPCSIEYFKWQSSKTEQGRNRIYEHLSHKHWNWNCDLKTPNKEKSRTWWPHRKILSNREELTSIHLKLFPKNSEEGKFPSSFYEITITLIPNQIKIPWKKKLIG